MDRWERLAAMNWALSLKRVFGGAMRIIVSIGDPDVIAKILTHLDAKGAEPRVPGRGNGGGWLGRGPVLKSARANSGLGRFRA